MGEQFLNVFARHGATGPSEMVSQNLEALSQQLAVLLANCDPSLRQDLLSQFQAVVAALLAKPADKAQQNRNGPEPISPLTLQQWKEASSRELTPEVLEWARQEFSEEELVAGFREVQETGGLQLDDFIPELEQMVGADELPRSGI